MEKEHRLFVHGCALSDSAGIRHFLQKGVAYGFASTDARDSTLYIIGHRCQSLQNIFSHHYSTYDDIGYG